MGFFLRGAGAVAERRSASGLVAAVSSLLSAPLLPPRPAALVSVKLPIKSSLPIPQAVCSVRSRDRERAIVIAASAPHPTTTGHEARAGAPPDRPRPLASAKTRARAPRPPCPSFDPPSFRRPSPPPPTDSLPVLKTEGGGARARNPAHFCPPKPEKLYPHRRRGPRPFLRAGPGPGVGQSPLPDPCTRRPVTQAGFGASRARERAKRRAHVPPTPPTTLSKPSLRGPLNGRLAPARRPGRHRL